MHKEREPLSSPLTIEQISQHSCELLLEQGSHVPTVLMQLQEGLTVIHFQDFGETARERRDQLRHAGWLFAQTCTEDTLEQVFFISEGWMSVPEAGEAFVRPSQHPQRKEILMVAQITAQGEALKQDMHLHELHRDAEGQLRTVSQIVTPDKYKQADNPLLMSFLEGYVMQLSSRGTPPATLH